MKDLYSKKYMTLMKEVEDTNKWKCISETWIHLDGSTWYFQRRECRVRRQVGQFLAIELVEEKEIKKNSLGQLDEPEVRHIMKSSRDRGRGMWQRQAWNGTRSGSVPTSPCPLSLSPLFLLGSITRPIHNHRSDEALLCMLNFLFLHPWIQNEH